MCIECFVSESLISFVVKFFVSLPSLNIIPSFFHQSYCKNECQRSNIGKEETHFQRWDQLRQTDKKEEKVEEKLELVEEYNWDECQNIIFCVV